MSSVSADGGVAPSSEGAEPSSEGAARGRDGGGSAGGRRLLGGERARKGLASRGSFLQVELERFQGPLDLLLHLIRHQDIDIFDIPISTITDQFLAAVGQIEVEDLDSAGEFLEMAATLIRIKAQMLLPRPEDDQEEDPRAELVRRLLEYEQIREIALRLSRSEAERARRFGKGYVEPRTLRYEEETPLETTWEEVLEAAMQVELPHPLTRAHRVRTGLVAVEEKIELILETLKSVARVEFKSLLAPWKEKMHGVMTLLAGLELARQRAVSLRQSRLFSELWLLRRDLNAWTGEIPGPAGDDAETSGSSPGTPADRSGPPAERSDGGPVDREPAEGKEDA